MNVRDAGVTELIATENDSESEEIVIMGAEH